MMALLMGLLSAVVLHAGNGGIAAAVAAHVAAVLAAAAVAICAVLPHSWYP